MKSIIIVMASICISFFACKEQVKKEIPAKEFHSKTFDWTITIPENFERVDNEDWAKMKVKGRAALEETIEGKIDDQTKRIFVLRSDKMHYMESNFQPYDTAVDGNFLESCTMVNNIIYQTFDAQMPDSKIDTLCGTETIDGLVFQSYSMNMTLPNSDKMLHMIMYTRLFGKKELSLNILYVDETKGKEMLAAWRGSKFGKK